MNTIALFGHREILNSTKIQERLMRCLIKHKGFSKILIGCHGDFDNIALSTCLNYKRDVDSNIEIDVVLTSLSFLNKNEFGFSKADYYNEKGCKTIFYDLEKTHYKNRIVFTNKKMVEDSDLIVCYVNFKSYSSGAKIAVNYAIKNKKPIINLFQDDKI